MERRDSRKVTYRKDVSSMLTIGILLALLAITDERNVSAAVRLEK